MFFFTVILRNQSKMQLCPCIRLSLEIRGGSLCRHRSAMHVPVPEPCDIPDELRSTVRGKNVGEGDDSFCTRVRMASCSCSVQTQNSLLCIRASTSSEMARSKWLQTQPISCTRFMDTFTVQGCPCSGGCFQLSRVQLKSYFELFSAVRQAFTDRFREFLEFENEYFSRILKLQ